MEQICYEVADNLTKICFIAHSLQRIIDANAIQNSQEDIEVAVEILTEAAETSLKALRKTL